MYNQLCVSSTFLLVPTSKIGKLNEMFHRSCVQIIYTEFEYIGDGIVARWNCQEIA